MKNSNFLMVILSFMMLCFITNVIGQNFSDAANKYRVIAFKNGNNQIMSVSNEVEIVPAAIIHIPNAFTPNGDGLNDTFGGLGEGLTEYNLQIFNRWGNLIFESNDMKNQWDGNYNNKLAPIGVYVYKINAKGPSANGRSKNLINEAGSVTLVL